MGPLAIEWHIGDGVRKNRISRGWSTQDLAARAGVSVRTINHLEAGDDVRTANLRAVATTFGLDLPDLYADIPRPMTLARSAEAATERRTKRG